MTEKLIICKQITLTLEGKKRFGRLVFDPEYNQLRLDQDPTEIANWERRGLTPWRTTFLTHGVPSFVPINFVEIRDFNHTEGVADQLAKFGLGEVYGDRPMDALFQPENPRRIKIVALKRDLIDQARTAAAQPAAAA